MNCPEHLVFKTRLFRIWHHQRADVRREYVTWREVFNPLRYELVFGEAPAFLVINKEAWMHVKFSNFIFSIKQKWRRP